ncbi:MAG: molybdopterin-dependent oxidoreductase [Thermoanaerobaculia bacterium]|nr:molybdopterin-dependent oxidoreductase [Thermoanaerobaculia bacterium]
MTSGIDDRQKGGPVTQKNATRRELLSSGAFLGGLAAGLGAGSILPAHEASGSPDFLPPSEEADPRSYVYTTCLQCNTGCEIKVRIQDGVAVKVEGNPYGPRTMDPHIPWTTPVASAAQVHGHTCPKGQAGIQSTYDPYRFVKVLKRAGKRGEGKWISIPFDQAVREIADGGTLFADVKGEETRNVEGLKAIWALRDPAVSKAMSDDVALIRSKKLTVAEFKARHAAHLDVLIDPDHPDYGPKNNQLVFNWGRLKGGRGDFFPRFWRDSFGSANGHGHTTVCQGSIYFAAKAMADAPSGGKWSGGAKWYWMADTAHAEFIIYWGAAILEGNYGPPLKNPKVMKGLSEKRLKVAVIDPRFSTIASKADRWFPIKPGTDAAFAMGMIRWILENQRYDRKYLENANKAAATADNEPTWSNGAWLVKIGSDGTPGKFLRASEIGLEGDADTFVCYRAGAPVKFKSGDTTNAAEGDLFVDTTIQGIRVKSGLQLLREAALAKTMAEWAAECDQPASGIAELAQEFTSHGKKAVVEIHRGVSQHTNGFYNVLATYALNLLIGNLDWQGGAIYGAGSYTEAGGSGRPFTLGDHPKRMTPFGVNIIRGEATYEESTFFSGYPTRRPWYPLASDVYQEVIPSMGDAYPYPVKAYFLYMGAPVYALPAGHATIPILADTSKIPLFVASDIVISETGAYADYLFPDLTYLERWEFHRTHPAIAHRVSPVRQPAVAPIPETVTVFGEQMPISMESVFLGLAEYMGMPGFGPNGFKAGVDLKRPEDFYLKMVANVAFGDSSAGTDVAPDATEEEVEVFRAARAHLPASVFDFEKWKAAVGDAWWRKTIYVLNRGGRWWSYAEAWSGGQVKAKYGKLVNLYLEKAATANNSMTGKPLRGIAGFLPIADSLGRPINDAAGYDLKLITNRSILQTKSRTISNYWLLDPRPENFIEVHTSDADRLGLRDGQKARIVSATNPQGVWDLKNGRTVPIVGTVKVTEGIRPGVATFTLGHGHWSYGSDDQVVDGQVVKGDPRRAAGCHPNAVMRLDDYMKNTTLSDVVGGSAVFYDTMVRVVPV